MDPDGFQEHDANGYHDFYGFPRHKDPSTSHQDSESDGQSRQYGDYFQHQPQHQPQHHFDPSGGQGHVENPTISQESQFSPWALHYPQASHNSTNNVHGAAYPNLTDHQSEDPYNASHHSAGHHGVSYTSSHAAPSGDHTHTTGYQNDWRAYPHNATHHPVRNHSVGYPSRDVASHESFTSHHSHPASARPRIELNPSFQQQPRRYFRPGAVFAVLWHEEAGNVPSRDNRAFSQTSWNTVMHSDIRRMVAIRQNNGSCLCLPIHTYGKRGAMKPGIDLRSHAPVLTVGSSRPYYQFESMIRDIIRVEPFSPDQVFDEKSLVDCSKVHTVESNWKVSPLGQITPDTMRALLHHYTRWATPRRESARFELG